MTDTICDLLDRENKVAFGATRGTEMHLRLQRITLDAPCKDAQLVVRIFQCVGLARFFQRPARAELPVAGFINGRFISRRLDRVLIDDAAKTVDILDYKTDVDRVTYRDKYVAQVGEYIDLMRRIYPDYTVVGYILWLHDWTLERLG